MPEGLSHAYISVQYAIEELGKLLIFREKLARACFFLLRVSCMLHSGFSRLGFRVV